MRLTLRNMLAYLNGIIEDPAEIEELRRKIEESEFATGLVHRIRSATSRQRLGAPNLEGRGIGLDPNSVAEYLDNELPPDRVPELEKVCVESDVHLAEVAACYQILALYIKGTVEADAGLQDRIRRIGIPGDARQFAGAPRPAGERAVSQPPAGAARVEPIPPPAVMIPPSPPPQTVVTPARKPFEVPEYLRVGQRGKWKPLAMTLLLAFVLSAVALRAMGPFNRHHPLMRLLSVPPAVEVVQGPSTAPGEIALESGVDEPPKSSATDGDAVAPKGTAADDPPETTVHSTGAKPPPPFTEDLDQRPDRKDPPADGIPAPGEATAGRPREADAGAPLPPSAPEDMVAETEPAPNGLRDPARPLPTEDDPVAPPDAPAAPVEVGYVKLSEPNFLVRYVAESADCFRLPARTKLMSGDRLLVLPTYRPEIVLTPGVQVVFTGPSSVQTKPHNAQGEPELAIEYGRALIATAGVAGARIHLDLAGCKGSVTFQEAASEMGVEVSHHLPPGVNPELESAWPVVHLYTTIGRIVWQATDSEAAMPIQQGQVRVIVGDQAETMAVVQTPAWMQGTDLRDVDRLASDALEPFIIPDRPVSLTLRERTDDRKSEIRSLAARCLAYLDSFETLVKEFGDDRQRPYWSAEYSVLRHSLLRSPETATKVRQVLEAFCGSDAAELYRLSWGYSAEQLREGGDRHLVDLLDHDSLRIRVFAFENLQRITKKTLLYMPEGSAARRKSSIQRWKEQLQTGAIVYESPPSPLKNQ
jgi:hypothetical protein